MGFREAFKRSPVASRAPEADPPPAYTSIAKTPAPGPVASASDDADKYAFLTKYDTVFLVDDSGSMTGPRWHEAAAALSSIVDICTQRDEDGIDLYFLNHRASRMLPRGKAAGGYYNLTSSYEVKSIFDAQRPYGLTFTGQRLDDILGAYIEQYQRDKSTAKPVNLIIITDGVPSDDPESIIVQHARKLDTLDAPLGQIGLQFFQIGNEREATEALRLLDDALVEQGVRDMVDTRVYSGGRVTAEAILKVVLGAVVRRLDRQK